MKRRREWSALLAGVMALGVLGGGISVSADEDVPTIVIYNNSGAFSVAGAEAGSDSSIYQKMQDYILEQTGVKVEIIMPPSDAGAQTEKLNLLLAGGDQIDAWWGDWRDYAKDGIILPLTDYIQAPEAKELKTQAMTDEKLEVVEVLGQTALFTNGRVTQKELPDGLYKYDLREGESIAFATVEPSVAVNHAGTIITKEPIIFGEEGYIEFDDNSSPNFLGDEMSIEEFLNTDFDQDEDESQTMGGMQL